MRQIRSHSLAIERHQSPVSKFHHFLLDVSRYVKMLQVVVDWAVEQSANQGLAEDGLVYMMDRMAPDFSPLRPLLDKMRWISEYGDLGMIWILDIISVFWQSELALIPKTNLSVCFTSFFCSILACFGGLWWPFTSHDTQGMSMLTHSIFGLGKASNQHWLLWRMREGHQLSLRI